MQIIRSSQPLSDDHFQYFIYQAGSVAGCCQTGLGQRSSEPCRP